MTAQAQQTAEARPDEAILLREDRGGVARLLLNCPAARNALSRALMAALQDALDAIAIDPTVKAVILAANGPAFSAGHDLREVRAHPGRAAYEALFADCSRLMQRIVSLPQPVIAEVQGFAYAAGCQLVATCDLAVAAETATFCTPGVNIGLFCSTPMVAVSRNLPRKQMMEMLLLGEAVTAGEAQRLGLVNRVAAPARLAAETRAMADAIAAKSPLTVKIGKEAFYRQLDMPLAEAYDYASRVMTENMLARDAEEGIDAFLEKRTPQWEGR
ncbi:MAG: enoyl-CoA hydratase [Rhodospirillaceae bacterium]|nr:enoyl-CoA hydratase [Rhodospirillaceae bacterium]